MVEGSIGVCSAHHRFAFGCFRPYDRLGLVIIDEEHEWTYKQESTPYYSAHWVATELCVRTQSSLVFGSATPALERYFSAQQGDYLYVSLPHRINESALPVIQVVDLREEFKKRNFSIFSLALQQAIRERLERREQVILFVNQRGLANAVVCRDCGFTEQCDRCDISLKFHRLDSQVGLEARERLMCHYCGRIKPVPLVCPVCQSSYIKYIGVGTQRVENDLKSLFPSVRTLRADRDTTQQKNGFDPIYQQFLHHEADVLIGTQMIAKGLDFKNVTLIGAILADVGLHLPDFRGGERLFQLMTQVAGRCGRGEIPGQVLLQTYTPDHPVIQHLAVGDYSDFAKQELTHRSYFNYPPFERLIKCTVVGTSSDALGAHVAQEIALLQDLLAAHSLPLTLSDAPALIPKMANRYYHHVLIQGQNPNLIFNYWTPPKHWRVDVDPVHTT
ncbi:primosomal protein N' [Candidatus Peregrinibacteria bacterium]|nr:MAG: primosomal protein N' [Candidatus Peregrinibacteria bacterium]